MATFFVAHCPLVAEGDRQECVNSLGLDGTERYAAILEVNSALFCRVAAESPALRPDLLLMRPLWEEGEYAE